MEQLTIDQAQAGDLTIFTLNGPLTLSTMFEFQSALRNTDLKGVVLDMAGVPYMDSAGLGVLLSQFVHAQRVALPFALAGANERVLRLFEITHTDKVLPLHASIADAQQALSSARVQ